MEKSGVGEQKSLIGELTQGRELANQLKAHLGSSCAAAASIEATELLLQKIITSYESALSMLSQSSAVSESPRSLSGSPRSEDSDREFRDQADLSLRSRKRKGSSSPRWTQQVQVCSGSGFEGPVDDGFCWRKYGQKDILGAKHPRGYYRCTHRNVQGCLATKQVQRSDDNPNIFEVIYRGRHTCSQSQFTAQALPPPPPETLAPPPPQPQNQLPQHQEIFMNSKPGGLRVITENLGLDSQRNLKTPPLLSFSLPSTPDTNAFASPSSVVLDGCFSAALQASPLEGFVGSTSIPRRGSGSDLNDLVLSATGSSAFTSPTTSVGFDGTFDPTELHVDFSFDNLRFFADDL